MINPDELAALEEQRDFLLASLDDLDREREAGDLDEADYQTLHADYTARAAKVLRAIEQAHALIDEAAPSHRGWRRVILVAAIAIVALVMGGVVTRSSGQKDQKAKSQLIPSKETQVCIDEMGKAFSPTSDGKTNPTIGTDAITAIKCFNAQIKLHPNDAVAYTYRGRTQSVLAQTIAGVVPKQAVNLLLQKATADFAKARALAPEYPDALAFSAIQALSTNDIPAARRYLGMFDELQLPANSPVLPMMNNVVRPAIESAATSTTNMPPPTSMMRVTSSTVVSTTHPSQ